MSSELDKLVPPGGGPLAWEQQEAKRKAYLTGAPTTPPPVSPAIRPTEAPVSESRPMQPAPPPRRTYAAELTYTPPPAVRAGEPAAVGFTLKFIVRSYHDNAPYITIEHGPNFSIVLTELVDNLKLKIGDKTWDVMWTGQAFSLPENDVYGISFLQCAKTTS